MHTPSRRNIMRLSLLAAVSPLATSAFAAWGAPLAIKGYDPVAYFTFGKPTRGLAEFEYEWDEHRYRFARAEHLELFKADPVHYAPQFAGFCAVALARGEIDEGNPEYWLVSEGKLYLFGNSLHFTRIFSAAGLPRLSTTKSTFAPSTRPLKPAL
jgi:YHS domain-containing protein